MVPTVVARVAEAARKTRVTREVAEQLPRLEEVTNILVVAEEESVAHLATLVGDAVVLSAVVVLVAVVAQVYTTRLMMVRP